MLYLRVVEVSARGRHRRRRIGFIQARFRRRNPSNHEANGSPLELREPQRNFKLHARGGNSPATYDSKIRAMIFTRLDTAMDAEEPLWPMPMGLAIAPIRKLMATGASRFDIAFRCGGDAFSRRGSVM